MRIRPANERSALGSTRESSTVWTRPRAFYAIDLAFRPQYAIGGNRGLGHFPAQILTTPGIPYPKSLDIAHVWTRHQRGHSAILAPDSAYPPVEFPAAGRTIGASVGVFPAVRLRSATGST
jgi:hypothetical protein